MLSIYFSTALRLMLKYCHLPSIYTPPISPLTQSIRHDTPESFVDVDYLGRVDRSWKLFVALWCKLLLLSAGQAV